MKKILLLFGFLAFFSMLSAQEGPKGDLFLKRTYPIDSCLYFQLPVDFIVRGTQVFGNGNTGVVTQFLSSNFNGSTFRGRGRFMINIDEFPVPGWNWEVGQTGEAILMVPDNALAAASGEPDANLDFPILINAFLDRIQNVPIEPPFAIYFQLMDMMEE